MYYILVVCYLYFNFCSVVYIENCRSGKVTSYSSGNRSTRIGTRGSTTPWSDCSLSTMSRCALCRSKIPLSGPQTSRSNQNAQECNILYFWQVIPYDGIRTTPHRPYEGQARAKFNFVAQTNMELSLVKGKIRKMRLKRFVLDGNDELYNNNIK